MSKQSQPGYPRTRLYVLNHTMLIPLFKSAGMPYLGVPHYSEINHIFGGIYPEDEVSDDNMALSRKMTEMLIRFAAMEDPNTTDTPNLAGEQC